MGADGGIAWVRVLNAERFRELVGPFRLMEFDDYHGAEHDAYLKKNPLPDDYIITTFGTDHDIDGTYDLCQMLKESEYIGEGFPDEADFSFLDLLVDSYTLPSWRASIGGTIYKVASRASGLDWRLRYGKTEEAESVLAQFATHPIWTMQIRKWGHEVKKVIDPKTFGWAETWT